MKMAARCKEHELNSLLTRNNSPSSSQLRHSTKELVLLRSTEKARTQQSSEQTGNQGPIRSDTGCYQVTTHYFHYVIKSLCAAEMRYCPLHRGTQNFKGKWQVNTWKLPPLLWKEDFILRGGLTGAFLKR